MKTVAFFSIFLFILTVNCQNTTESKNLPPGQVILVNKSAEDDTLEMGIDAEAIAMNGRNGIFLQWYPVRDEDLTAYDIFRSEQDSTGKFSKIMTLQGTSGQIDTFYFDTDPLLEDNFERFYYYVQARDEAGQVGPRSKIVNYRLIPHPDLAFPINVSVQGDINFQWDFNPNFVPNSFVFRLQKQGAGNFKYYYIQLFDADTDYDLTPHQEWNLNRLGISTSLPTGTYRWRIDALGAENNQGSESTWARFIVQ